MNDTLQTLIRAALKIGAGVLLSKGITNDSQNQEIIASIMGLIGIVWGVCHRTSGSSTNATSKSGGIYALFFLGALGALVVTTGCTSTVNNGHVVSVTTRFYGLHYGQQVQNPTSPDITLGIGSSTVVVMPTVTNNVLAVPPVANTFSLGQTGSTIMFPVVDETFASGNYATGSSTNVVQAQPIVAK